MGAHIRGNVAVGQQRRVVESATGRPRPSQDEGAEKFGSKEARFGSNDAAPEGELEGAEVVVVREVD